MKLVSGTGFAVSKTSFIDIKALPREGVVGKEAYELIMLDMFLVVEVVSWAYAQMCFDG